MGKRKLALGLDFGTESGRALLVDVATGEEVAVAVHEYADGVVDERLPGMATRLEPDWALQNPADYIATLQHAVPEALRLAVADPEDVIGIGVDFTASTVLPTTSDGTPLSFLEAWRTYPHAWTKLWKHHAAQPEADRITALAMERNAPWLARYGGRISSEWLHSKALQVLEEAPDIFAAADRFIEGGDWIVWQMTGREVRNSCAAGCKGLWEGVGGFPGADFLRALDPRMGDFNETKLCGEVLPIGSRAGWLTDRAAAWTGLPRGIPVAVATIDAHAAVPGSGVAAPGTMVLILGTSTCHMLVSEREQLVAGISGVTRDSIIPGLYGYEAGQAAVGDIFEWFVRNGLSAEYGRAADERGISPYQLLEEEAARLRPGQSGLLALDWWNGNRSVLVDATLSGMLVGVTLATRPSDIYRALIEATAFGTRIIIDTFESNGIPIAELVAAGGLAGRNKLLLQIYADVTGREFHESESTMASALGAAMFGAVAAGSAGGGYDSIADAARCMASSGGKVYRPEPAHHAIYNRLFAEYQKLHDYFGRGENDVMRRLRGMMGDSP